MRVWDQAYYLTVILEWENISEEFSATKICIMMQRKLHKCINPKHVYTLFLVSFVKRNTFNVSDTVYIYWRAKKIIYVFFIHLLFNYFLMNIIVNEYLSISKQMKSCWTNKHFPVWWKKIFMKEKFCNDKYNAWF